LVFTKYFATFDKETFTLHVFFTQSAVETLRMVVIIESLHPSVPSFYGEPTGDAFGGEQFIPVFFTIRKTILQIERSICQYLSTVDTGEALWMEVGAHCLQTVLLFHFQSHS